MNNLELLHSYTFTNPLKVDDSIQGETYEGSLQGQAYISQGKVYFNNQGVHTNKTLISLPSNPIEQFKVITIELWANLSPISNTLSSRSLFYFGQPSKVSIRCYHNQSSGYITCLSCYNQASCTSMSSLVSYHSGSIHLVATFHSFLGSMAFSINSIPQSYASLPFSLPNGGASDFIFLIGSSVAKNEESFEGSFDEFRIWAGAIAPLTVTSHYENGPTSNFTNPTSELGKIFFCPFFVTLFPIYILISHFSNQTSIFVFRWNSF